MIPILWRYLLTQYIKVLSLATAAFLTILFVTKLKQIAQFATLGNEGGSILLFAANLVPYVLPFTLPISCLISSILLFQRMSQSQELTAMRSSGLALRQITGPIILASALLSLGSFFVTSELATHSRLTSKRLLSKITSVNPLNLLQNSQLLRLGEIYVDMRTITSGEEARDLLVALYNPGMGRIQLITAEEIKVDQGQLSGSHVALISSAQAKEVGQFDHLLLENQKSMEVPIDAFKALIRKMTWSLEDDFLRLRLLRVRINELRSALKQEEPGSLVAQQLIKLIRRCYVDLFKRISLALAVFSFTLLGCSFGIDLNRYRRRRKVVYVLILSALFLTCYATSKGYIDQFGLVIALLFLPQLLIICFSIAALKRITAGGN